MKTFNYNQAYIPDYRVDLSVYFAHSEKEKLIINPRNTGDDQ